MPTNYPRPRAHQRARPLQVTSQQVGSIRNLFQTPAPSVFPPGPSTPTPVPSPSPPGPSPPGTQTPAPESSEQKKETALPVATPANVEQHDDEDWKKKFIKSVIPFDYIFDAIEKFRPKPTPSIFPRNGNLPGDKERAAAEKDTWDTLDAEQLYTCTAFTNRLPEKIPMSELRHSPSFAADYYEFERVKRTLIDTLVTGFQKSVAYVAEKHGLCDEKPATGRVVKRTHMGRNQKGARKKARDISLAKKVKADQDVRHMQDTEGGEGSDSS